MVKEFKRPDGRKLTEMRPIKAEVGVVPNADGSAMFQSGKTIAIAAVYGPKKMHPQHKQDPSTGQLRCEYNMISFSVDDRIRPGRNRRAMEISEITKWALEPSVMLEKYPNQVVDIHINIIQADAGTRCAGINAAAMALADAGIVMKEMVTSVSIGKIDDKIVTDIIKEEEDHHEGEGATDIPYTITSNSKAITHLQLDGKIQVSRFKEATDAAIKACEKVLDYQIRALKGEKIDETKGKK